MGTFRQLFKLRRHAWSLAIGLLLVGFLHGCKLIEVEVQVTNMGGACPSGRGGPVPGPAGACYGTTLSSNKDATGAWHTTLNRTIVAGDNLKCRAGTVMCNSSNPGYNFLQNSGKVTVRRIAVMNWRAHLLVPLSPDK